MTLHLPSQRKCLHFATPYASFVHRITEDAMELMAGRVTEDATELTAGRVCLVQLQILVVYNAHTTFSRFIWHLTLGLVVWLSGNVLVVTLNTCMDDGLCQIHNLGM